MTTAPERHSIWKHVKTGGMYIVLGMCRLEAHGTECVRYANAREAASIEWIRPLSEWHELVGEPPTPRFVLQND